MALIIEDGSIVVGADSYISLVDARTMATNLGLSLPTDDTQAEIILRQAYLSLNTYEQLLQGWRMSAEQTGIFPRSSVEKACFPIASNSIPGDIVLSQLYQADAISSGSTSVNDVSTGEKLSSFEVFGAYKESYQEDSTTNLNAIVQGVQNVIYPYTNAGKSGGGYGVGLGREGFGFVGR